MAQLLLQRIAFTARVAGAFRDEEDLQASLGRISEAVQAKRQAAIRGVRDELPKAERMEFGSLITLFTEQLDVLADLGAKDAATARGIWKDEFRFHETPCGRVRCACGDQEMCIGFDFPATRILVTTALTRSARKEIFGAMLAGKPYLAMGPAGTGKTETVSDTMRALGMEATRVYCRCNDADDDGAATLEAVREAVRKAKKNHHNAPVLLDEVNSVPADKIDAVLDAATEGFTRFAAFSVNTGCAERTPMPEAFMARCVRQEFTVPDHAKIYEVMLASKGFSRCDALGPALATVLRACRAKCSKQAHYDYGLRKGKSITVTASALGRDKGFDDETRLLVDAVTGSLFPMMVGADQLIFLQAVKAAFGVEASVPSAWKCEGGKSWDAVGAMVAATRAVRHGVAVVGCSGDGDVAACVEAIRIATGGSKSILVDTDVDEGEFWGAGGADADAPWKDGQFWAAFREAQKVQGEVNVVVAGSALESGKGREILNVFNSLLDDNKFCRNPVSGEVLNLKPHMRIVILTRHCDSWSPANVSRVGFVAVPTTAGSGGGGGSGGLVSRTAQLEMAVVGKAQSGAILPRVAALEELVTGQVATGDAAASISARLAALEAAM